MTPLPGDLDVTPVAGGVRLDLRGRPPTINGERARQVA